MHWDAFACATAVALSLLVTGCPPSPSPPGPDSGDAAPPSRFDAGVTDCNIACAQLAIVGCPEGQDAKCSSTCQLVQRSQITDLHLPCLTAARSKADVRRCGSVACP